MSNHVHYEHDARDLQITCASIIIVNRTQHIRFNVTHEWESVVRRVIDLDHISVIIGKSVSTSFTLRCLLQINKVCSSESCENSRTFSAEKRFKKRDVPKELPLWKPAWGPALMHHRRTPKGRNPNLCCISGPDIRFAYRAYYTVILWFPMG